MKVMTIVIIALLVIGSEASFFEWYIAKSLYKLKKLFIVYLKLKYGLFAPVYVYFGGKNHYPYVYNTKLKKSGSEFGTKKIKVRRDKQ